MYCAGAMTVDALTLSWDINLSSTARKATSTQSLRKQKILQKLYPMLPSCADYRVIEDQLFKTLLY